MTEVYYLNLRFLYFTCTPGKGLGGKYWDTDRQMKPLFFKCHDSKTRCQEGGATTCPHSLQSLKQGLKLRVSGVCSVICCKHGMKEVESRNLDNKICAFVKKKKELSSQMSVSLLCLRSQQATKTAVSLILLLCMLGEPATALTLFVSSHHHTVLLSTIAGIRGMN